MPESVSYITFRRLYLEMMGGVTRPYPRELEDLMRHAYHDLQFDADLSRSLLHGREWEIRDYPEITFNPEQQTNMNDTKKSLTKKIEFREFIQSKGFTLSRSFKFGGTDFYEKQIRGRCVLVKASEQAAGDLYLMIGFGRPGNWRFTVSIGIWGVENFKANYQVFETMLNELAFPPHLNNADHG